MKMKPWVMFMIFNVAKREMDYEVRYPGFSSLHLGMFSLLRDSDQIRILPH